MSKEVAGQEIWGPNAIYLTRPPSYGEHHFARIIQLPKGRFNTREPPQTSRKTKVVAEYALSTSRENGRWSHKNLVMPS